jgi:hypothetical protein
VVKHRNRVNLILHVPAVALFWVGTIVLVGGAIHRALAEIAIAVACLIVSVAAPFPRFVLAGGWYRALTQSKAR